METVTKQNVNAVFPSTDKSLKKKNNTVAVFPLFMSFFIIDMPFLFLFISDPVTVKLNSF